MDYHVNSLFPDLLNFGILSSVILRLVLGLIFINLGYLKLTGERISWVRFLRIVRVPQARLVNSIIGLVEIIGGLMLIAGLYTQGVAIVFGLLALIQISIESLEDDLIKRDFVFYFMIIAICLSLLLTGPGVLALDLPL
ncbi:MAG: DoxX family protein [Minisyncoccia bacterium]